MMSPQEYNAAVLVIEPEIKRFAMWLTHNRDDAQDLVQDTFLKALRYRSEFRDDINLKGWVISICKNTFINNYRMNKHHKTIVDVIPDLYYLNNKVGTTTETPESVCIEKEIQEMVSQTLPLWGDPFKMHVDGYGYKEIAEKLDTPIGTVKSHIFTARKVLKGMVETGKGFKPVLKTNIVKSNTFEPMDAEIIKFRNVCEALIEDDGYNKNMISIESGVSWPSLKKVLESDDVHFNISNSRSQKLLQNIIAFNKKHIGKFDFSELTKTSTEAERDAQEKEVFKRIPSKDIIQSDVESHPFVKFAPDLHMDKMNDIEKKQPDQEELRDQIVKEIEHSVQASAEEVNKAYEELKGNTGRDAVQVFIKQASFWELIALAGDKLPDNVVVDIRMKK
jgi:RNA polymerase sigma-70 factor, ECF subfamily